MKKTVRTIVTATLNGEVVKVHILSDEGMELPPAYIDSCVEGEVHFLAAEQYGPGELARVGPREFEYRAAALPQGAQ